MALKRGEIRKGVITEREGLRWRRRMKMGDTR